MMSSPSSKPQTRTEATIVFEIFVAGDLPEIRKICRKHCLDIGLCVTVSPTEFIYTAGMEAGAVIGVRNYPRFPADRAQLEETATGLAIELAKGCCQSSCMIVGPEKTTWLSWRNNTQPHKGDGCGGSEVTA